MKSLLEDLRHALRAALKRSGLTAVIVLNLAIGIGASTAVFTVLHGVMMRPLPYRDSQELVLIWSRAGNRADSQRAGWSGPDLLDLRERADLFQGIAAVAGFNTSLRGEGAAEPIQMGVVTANFFDLLGIVPVEGRGFEPSDQQNHDPEKFFGPGGDPPPGVTVLSHEIWERRFGVDPQVVGKTIRIGDQPMTVVGIAPPGFRLNLPADSAVPSEIDVWVVVATDLASEERESQWLTLIGRLHQGVGVQAVQQQMDKIVSQLRREHPSHSKAGLAAQVVPMLQDVVSHVKTVLYAAFGAVFCVLLISCANVANLLLLRGQARKRELAIRAALGAGRTRMLRQMLTESLLFSVLGAGSGLLLAWAGVDFLLSLRPANLPRIEAISIDGEVLAYIVGLSVLAALLFGTLPALKSARLDLTESLRQRASNSPHSRSWLRSGLVAAEMAVCVLLLTASGLFLRSLSALNQVDPGFDPAQALTVNVSLPFFKYRDPGAATATHLRIAEEVGALPGVDAVSAVTPLPLAGGGQYWRGPFALTEMVEEELQRNEAAYRPCLPGLFEALGTRLIMGRDLTEADNRPEARPVVVIDEKMAQRAWPGQNPIGRRMTLVRAVEAKFVPYQAEVVGVVEHVRYAEIGSAGDETLYIPHVFWEWADLHYIIRTSLPLAQLSPSIRQIIQEVDPDIPAATPTPFQGYVDEALAPTRFLFLLMAIFAGASLSLACLGLYGVIAESVRRRNHEIAVRLALGAMRGAILKSILARALILTGIGAALGLAGALMMMRLISSLLYGVSATDPLTYAIVLPILACVAIAAGLVPALRATRVAPVQILEAE